MIHNLLNTDRDLKEAALIEKRREAEKARQKRFFDAKQRILGIDCEALDSQVNEKQRQKKLEADQELIAHQEMERNLKIAQAKEEEINSQKREMHKELNEYRQQYQTKDVHQEITDNMPARQDDNDPRLSISGGQLFIGEDLTNKQRLHEQKMLQKAWLDQQIMEKKKMNECKKDADYKISETLVKRDIQAINIGERMDFDKREVSRQIREYNENLAKQKRENNLKKKQQEEDDNLAEIYNLLTSDLLKEKTDSSSNLGPNRIIPYMYKGMSSEEIEKFYKEKFDQLSDLNKRRQDEEFMKQKWDQLASDMNRQMTLKERELSRTIRNINHRCSEDNKQLAEEQKHNQEYINNVVNKNQVTPEYFEQFNTTSR